MERFKEQVEQTALGPMFIGVYRCGDCRTRFVNRVLISKDSEDIKDPYDKRQFETRFGPVASWVAGKLVQKVDSVTVA